MGGSLALTSLKLLSKAHKGRIMFAPKTTVYAHFDLPCGVYYHAQAKIEALSVKAFMVK